MTLLRFLMQAALFILLALGASASPGDDYLLECGEGVQGCIIAGTNISVLGDGIDVRGYVTNTSITVYRMHHSGHGSIIGCGYDASWDWNWSTDGTCTFDGRGKNQEITAFFTGNSDDIVTNGVVSSNRFGDDLILFCVRIKNFNARQQHNVKLTPSTPSFRYPVASPPQVEHAY